MIRNLNPAKTVLSRLCNGAGTGLLLGLALTGVPAVKGVESPSAVPVLPSDITPLFNEPVRDPQVCVGPDGTYYLTGTTGHPTWWSYNEGIRLWKSRDLKAWEPLGLVWSFKDHATWQVGRSSTQEPPARKCALWAPEIHFLKGNFHIVYCLNGKGTGILRSRSGKAEGPYEDVKPDGPITGEIDASLFEDDGKVYLVWQNGKLARLKDDLSGLAESPRHLKPANAAQVGFEGAYLAKINGRYHLLCAEWNSEGDKVGYYDCMAASADSLLGPYGDRYLAIPGGGHNAVFKDAGGRWWSTYFGNDVGAPFRERAAILPIHLDAAGRIRPGREGTVAIPELSPRPVVSCRETPGAFPLQAAGQGPVTILVETNRSRVIATAVRMFAEDLGRVTGTTPAVVSEGAVVGGTAVIVGMAGAGGIVDRLAKAGTLDLANLQGPEGGILATVLDPLPGVSRALVVAGADARGAAYVLMELARQMGVSPWYWWADVPVRKSAALYVTAGTYVQRPPTVRYRGIFLNDEAWGLNAWAKKTCEKDPPDIGPKTYARIFELLLRLKANYCWPAMWPCTRAFNHYPANKQVADEYGIIMGSSHCEPMLRNNVDEWHRWAPPDGKPRGEWDYAANAGQVNTYWEERVRENASFENIYTLGMRGIHDSGMAGSGEQGVRLLEQIIETQRAMLERQVGRPAATIPQMLCPYKEVLDLYNKGLRVPGDVTLVWADDNFGYMRQLSSPGEQQRPGGSGLYYHLSYIGGPADYIWLSTTAPHRIGLELRRALAYGADRLWVFNVGDLKPAERELTYALDMAWDARNGTPERTRVFVQNFFVPLLGEGLARGVAALFDDYYRLAHRCKPEHYEPRWPTHKPLFGAAEVAERRAAYARIASEAQRLEARVAPEGRDAYYQLALFPLRGAALMSEVHHAAQVSLQLAAGGQPQAALAEAAKAGAAHAELLAMVRAYNEELAGGKWRGMMGVRRGNEFRMPATAAGSPFAGKATNAPPARLPDPRWSAEPGRFARAASTESARIVTVPWCGPDLVTVEPATAPSVPGERYAEAPWVEYELEVPTGACELEIRALPTQPAHRGRGVRIAVSIDGAAPRIGDFQTTVEGRGNAWGHNVLRGYGRVHMPVSTPEAKQVRVRIYLLDPGVALSGLHVFDQAWTGK